MQTEGVIRSRFVTCVLSGRSLPYAELCFSSLLNHSLEPVHLVLITDGAEDVSKINEALDRIEIKPQHQVSIKSKFEADEIGLRSQILQAPHKAGLETGFR
jgi:hypothetical protein